MDMAKIYIGTSGFSYPHWEGGVFYPKDLPKTKKLEYYSQNFNTVELNSPFYHLPEEKTFLNWKNKVPQDFVFAVKVSRVITHIKKLKGVKNVWQKFFKRAILLENKLGPFLFQFSSNFSATNQNIKNLDGFLKFIHVSSCNYLRKFPRLRFAFEFRHISWFSENIYQVFKKYQNAAICLVDSPYWPLKEEITGDFVYIRMHGSKSLYSSNYSDDELRAWFLKIKKYLKPCSEQNRRKNLDVYVYFNNDANGYAVKNAKRLLEMTTQNR